MNYFYFSFLFFPIVIASKETSVECGACLMVINEIEKSILASDPKKKLTVGSFRVDPKGNQATNDIPYARSQMHINELLEDVCDKYNKYTQAVHPVTGKLTFAHEDLVIEYKRKGKSSKLQFACNDFIDAHENEIVKFMQQETEKPTHSFCYTQLELCSAVDCVPFPDYKEEQPNQDEEANAENDEL
uniref:DUF3456 domain-containing protein n=1 Tax=Panagrolaimus sp. JU765 TaxID=591449 RepID=A0AC34PWJ1_9BILA